MAVLSLLSLALTVAVVFAVENADRARRGEGAALEARDGARARYRDSQRNLANATALLARAARDQGDRAAATTYAAAAAGTYPTPAVQAEHLLRPRPRTRPLLRFRAAHSARPFLAVDPGGEVLVTADESGAAVVRDLATARVRALLRPSAGTPVSAAFSPAGSLLALGVDRSSSRRTLDARDPDRATSLVLYQVGTWEERRQLGRRGLFSRADCIGFSVDSRWLAAGVDDRLLVWDLSSSSPPI